MVSPAHVAFVAVALLCASSPVAAAKQYWFELPSNVTALVADTFDTFVAAHDVVAVEFYNPGCPICRAFAPEMDRTVDIAKALGMDVQFAKVNCDDEVDLNDRFHVSLYPTLTAFVPSAVKAAPESASTLTVVDDAASALVGKLRFAVVESDEVIDAFKLPTDSVTLVLYKDFDEGREVYAGALTAADLTAWLSVRSRPIAQTVTPQNIRKLQATANAFILHAFVGERGVEDGGHRVALLNDLRTVGKALEAEGLAVRGSYALTLVNGEAQKSWKTPFHLLDTPMPSVGLVVPATNTFYTLPGAVGTLGGDDDKPTLDTAAITKFVKDFLAGSLTPEAVTDDREL